MKKILTFICVGILVLGIARAATADIIDFEGFAPLTPLGSVITPTNNVTFSVGSLAGLGPAYVAGVGSPTTAFVPSDTAAGGVAGTRFLTDEIAGPSAKLDYFIAFTTPVLNPGCPGVGKMGFYSIRQLRPVRS